MEKSFKKFIFPENNEVSAFFALLALFWIYPILKRTAIIGYLRPSGLRYEVVIAALCVGIIFGVLALKKDIYPLLSNTYILLVYLLFLPNLGKPQPTYIIVLVLAGLLFFFPIAWRKIIVNSSNNYEICHNISKYLFILALIIQSLNSILSYQIRYKNALILILGILSIGITFGWKGKKVNNIWLKVNTIYFVCNIIDLPGSL